MNKQIAPDNFNKQCAAVLARYVESHDSLVWNRDGFDKVTFSCMNRDNPIYSDGSYFLRVSENGSLLLRCALTYIEPYPNATKETKFSFQGISLQFFHGPDYCFCRAEWALKDKPDKLAHPQPHWHYGVKNSLNIFEGDFTGESNELFTGDAPSDESRKPNINFTELHYAMSSKWMENGEDNLIFSFQDLIKWMENALVMVIDQYNYQANKKGFISVKR